MARITLEVAWMRIAKLYPGIDINNMDDPRAVHVRKIIDIVEDYFNTIPEKPGKKPNMDRGLPRYEEIILTKTYYWRIIRGTNHGLPDDKLDTLLPSHEEVFAAKILSDDNQHSPRIIEAMAGTSAEQLLELVECPEDTKDTKTKDIKTKDTKGGVKSRPDDIARQTRRLRMFLEKKLKSVQKEKAQVERDEKVLQAAIKNITSGVPDVNEALMAASVLSTM